MVPATISMGLVREINHMRFLTLKKYGHLTSLCPQTQVSKPKIRISFAFTLMWVEPPRFQVSWSQQ